MLIKGTSYQPRFGMWHFDIPTPSNDEEKERQKRVLNDMCDTFRKKEGANLSWKPGSSLNKWSHFPARVYVDNNTAEESILGKIQTFLRKRGFEVNPSEQILNVPRTPPLQTTQVNKRQRMNRMDVNE
jgi:hypothetical protein